MLPSIRLDDIETAIKVTECKHFTRAGAKLHKDQTSVSKCMRRVESQLGAKLVDRSAHPVRPTKAGAVFLYWGRKGLHALERGFAEVRRASEPDQSTLHVGHTTYLDLDVLAYIENLCAASAPGFLHTEHSSSSSEIIVSVLSGIWDCGFIVSPATTEGLVGLTIYQEPFGLVLPSDHHSCEGTQHWISCLVRGAMRRRGREAEGGAGGRQPSRSLVSGLAAHRLSADAEVRIKKPSQGRNSLSPLCRGRPLCGNTAGFSRRAAVADAGLVRERDTADARATPARQSAQRANTDARHSTSGCEALARISAAAPRSTRTFSLTQQISSTFHVRIG